MPKDPKQPLDPNTAHPNKPMTQPNVPGQKRDMEKDKDPNRIGRDFDEGTGGGQKRTQQDVIEPGVRKE